MAYLLRRNVTARWVPVPVAGILSQTACPSRADVAFRTGLRMNRLITIVAFATGRRSCQLLLYLLKYPAKKFLLPRGRHTAPAGEKPPDLTLG